VRDRKSLPASRVCLIEDATAQLRTVQIAFARVETLFAEVKSVFEWAKTQFAPVNSEFAMVRAQFYGAEIGF
jgi:hypothetical protein